MLGFRTYTKILLDLDPFGLTERRGVERDRTRLIRSPSALRDKGLHASGEILQTRETPIPTLDVSFPVKETVSKENFWLQVGPDTWRVGDLPMRHGAVLHCSSVTIRH